MALLNSFNSGVSGIKAFSKSLEVIGDNIANVNTTGFKGSKVTNQDNFSQTLRDANAEANYSQNSMQVGSGTSVASISQEFTQGVLSTTGSPTDLGISGRGFFQVTDPLNTATPLYTRAGDFRLDSTGNLVTNNGFKVVGATPIAANVVSFKIEKDGNITTFDNTGTKANAGKINLFSFTNPNGLKREGDNLFSNNNTPAGAATPDTTSEIIQGTLELSNVDLTEQFADLIVAQRSFQANSRIVTVSDSVMEEIVNLKR